MLGCDEMNMVGELHRVGAGGVKIVYRYVYMYVCMYDMNIYKYL